MFTMTNLTFMSVFDFNDKECMQKFLDFARSENGIRKTRNYTGCISINAYMSKREPNKLIMIQEWDSKQHKKAYLAMREKEGIYQFFDTLVKTKTVLDVITPMDFNSKL